MHANTTISLSEGPVLHPYHPYLPEHSPQRLDASDDLKSYDRHAEASPWTDHESLGNDIEKLDARLRAPEAGLPAGGLQSNLLTLMGSLPGAGHDAEALRQPSFGLPQPGLSGQQPHPGLG